MCGFYLIALLLMVLSKVSCHYDDYSNGYYYEKALPQDVMVDVINNFGVALLEAHNENNNNNIALSPYGATSVLIALGEGLRGYAVQEIQEAARIPQDVSVIRVGLRDIHRHLKSYFIPKEGFLAGLTLNNEKVQLNDEYKEILRFYGFDLDSFNIPLYPDVFETTTEMRMNVTETSTSTMNSDPPISTTTEKSGTTQVIEPSTESVPETTETSLVTEKVNSVTEIVTETTSSVPTEKTTRIQTRSTDSVLKSTEMITSTLIPQTTADLKSTEMINLVEQTTSNPKTSTIPALTTELLTSSIPTTTEFKIDENVDESKLLTSPSIINDEVTFTTSNPSSTELITSTELISTSINSITESEITSKIETTTVQISTEALNVVTTTEKSVDLDENEDNDSNEDNEDNDLNEDNNVTEDNDINEDENVTTEIASESEIKKRNSRSIVDYIIARHYDNKYKPSHFNNNNLYVPDENPTFLIYGTIREPNINFMKYDAVLPVAFLPLLNSIALSFPLDSKEYYLLLILPVDETGIDKLIHNLAHTMNLRDIIMSLRYSHVKAIIPSFMLKGYVVLTPSLQKLGIQRIFEPRRTDFSLMTNEKDVYVTNIEQAVTVTIRNYVNADNLPNYRNLQSVRPVLFQADHPFLYFVMDAEIHVALMAGKIVNPLNSRIR
nr:serpin H1 [Onthophagus taurus]